MDTLINHDHRHLEQILDRIKRLVVSSNGLASPTECLGEIVDYYVGHFDLEERLMHKSEYGHIKNHLKDHSKILNLISEALATLEKFGWVRLDEITENLLGLHQKHLEDFDQSLIEFVENGCYPPSDAFYNARVPRF